MTRKTLAGAALAVLTAGVVLAGCGSGMDQGSPSDPPQTPSEQQQPDHNQADHNQADIAFAQQMIPHHEGALEMAALAADRTSNSEILDLSGRIERAQDPEIKQMTGWLKAWGAPASGGDHGDMPGMEHGDMPGMMDKSEMDSLLRAKDAEFDKRFLELMTMHHQGAVKMSETELAEGSNAEAKVLAQRIIDAQRAEIAEMNELRTQG